MERDIVCFDHNIFGTLDLHFSLYKGIMDNFEDTGNIYAKECKFIQENTEKHDNDLIYINDICIKWYPYLNQIRYYNEQEILKGLQYMYYWLYRNYLSHGIKEENINRLYKKLIKRYSETSFAQKIDKPVLSDDLNRQEWKTLIGIINLSIALNEIKVFSFESSKKQSYCDYLNGCVSMCKHYIGECTRSASPNICDIFENIENQINDIILENGCNDSNHQISPSTNSQNEPLDSSSNIKSRTIIISAVLILLTPMLVFILYKVNYDFKLCNSYLLHRIKKKINRWKKDDKEWNIQQHSEMSNSISSHSMYNILYNST
ncbi:variable surface protein [Plasmodium gonderi]|uniref:Variable surface protein n=1 Tax=Plasmodium gonderi TaxID=77519 RepID=A0A1Y1JR34_PLAGO|nr:variable surface protein [Plasmodium gonderi]GAW83955.1 variable surface protein [Plasmodium gonderi]